MTHIASNILVSILATALIMQHEISGLIKMDLWVPHLFPTATRQHLHVHEDCRELSVLQMIPIVYHYLQSILGIFCSTENHSYNKQPLQPSHVNPYSLIRVPATVFTVEKRMAIRFGTKVMIGIRPNDPWRVQGHPTSISKNTCSEDDLRSRIFRT